jgi:hypothetical protein
MFLTFRLGVEYETVGSRGLGRRVFVVNPGSIFTVVEAAHVRLCAVDGFFAGADIDFDRPRRWRNYVADFRPIPLNSIQVSLNVNVFYVPRLSCALVHVLGVLATRLVFISLYPSLRYSKQYSAYITKVIKTIKSQDGLPLVKPSCPMSTIRAHDH